jgi:YHS domain-containing protein
MILVELFVPKGALDRDSRQRLAERLVDLFLTDDEKSDLPAETLTAHQAIHQVLVHEVEPWIVGGRAVGTDEPPRYVVRISVPAPWRKDLAPEYIARVTRVLADADADPERFHRDPVAWVQVIGVSEGGLGSYGRVLTSTEISDLVTKPFRESPDRAEFIAAAAARGLAVDPICGMTVPLAEATDTLLHEGNTYAFCCEGCRKTFLAEVNA